MAQSWKALKGEYDARIESIRKADEFLAEKKKQYEEEIKDTTNFIKRENVELSILRGVEVTVDVADVVDELAKLMGVSDNDLSVRTDILGNRRSKGSIESLADELYYMHKTGVKGEIRLIITDKDNCSLTVELPFDYNAIQKNGKPMGKCVSIQPATFVNYRGRSGVGAWHFELIGDYRNLVTKCTVGALMGYKYHIEYPDLWRQAVVNVLERQHESSQESVMGDE